MPTLKEHIRNIEKALEKLKKKNKGKHFISATPDEIEGRLKGADDPWIVGFGIDAPPYKPGGAINITFAILNSGAPVFFLYIHVWVGSGIIDLTGDKLLLEIDTRFPRLTEPAYAGLNIDRRSSGYLDFTMAIPTTIEKTNYCLCYCLMQVDAFSSGRAIKLFDRGIIPVEVA
jgi:hypothetical protein